MRILKTLISAAGFCVLTFGFFWLGWMMRDIQPEPQVSIRESVMNLQRRVGCQKIDAVIGPESTANINVAVKAEEKELFNDYATVYMTPSGAPK